MNDKRVLITGGAGFIGKHLANTLVNKGYEVIVIDDLSLGSLDGLEKVIKFYKVNILNKTKIRDVFKKFKPSIVFHLAARSSRHPKDKKVLDNIQGTLNILNSCLEVEVKKFIFPSSAAVYGNAIRFPVAESAILKPINNYGISKVASERLIESLFDQSSVYYTILRLANVYGPGQRFDNEGGVVSILGHKIQTGKKVTVHSDGNQTRDFVYVADVVDAMIRSIKVKRNLIMNVSTKSETSINSLIKIVESITQNKLKVEYDSKKFDEIRRSVLDNRKIRREIDWKPSIQLKKGITKTYNLLEV